MSTLRNLYKQVILEHSRKPRHYGELPDATHREGGHNLSCGDQLEVQLKYDAQNQTIADIRFTAKGCAISVASASLMMQAVRGKTVTEAAALSASFGQMLRTGEVTDDLGDLAALQGVHTLATRTKCAALAWQTLDVLLSDLGPEQ